MTTTLSKIAFVFILSISLLFVMSGLIHLLIYAFDDKPFLSGLRYINYTYLIIGAIVLAFVIKKLDKI